MEEQGLIPFGAGLQADTTVLRTGLATVLGLVENALAGEGLTAEELLTTLENIRIETIQALKDEKVSQKMTPLRGIGGFGGEPKIDWSE
jgi:hypothetical protein